MHLGEHKGILPCLQITDSGLVFPYLKNGNLRHFLCNSRELITFSTKLDWIQTALRSIEFIHSKDVLQADISARNFLVANDLSLSLCDFAGSTVGTRKNLVRPETRYEKVRGTEPIDISVDSEVFAIGSLIYEISTGKRPYDEIEDDEVENLFSQRVFPTTNGLYFGGIIDNCWLGQYKSVAEILHAGPFTEARHI
jgi:serine/threonine protein kinase